MFKSVYIKKLLKPLTSKPLIEMESCVFIYIFFYISYCFLHISLFFYSFHFCHVYFFFCIDGKCLSCPVKAGPTPEPSCCCVETRLGANGVIKKIKYLLPPHHSSHQPSLSVRPQMESPRSPPVRSTSCLRFWWSIKL